MFYPQLVAGPIERPQNMIHQFYEKHNFNDVEFVEGLKRMLWGFFKKIVVADNLSRIVNLCFDNPNDHSGIMLLVSTLFFTFQIYCDFSGYTDIAIGSAQCMGFKLMRNFNLPYLSKSISEFWSRWHISLSTWFKDYLYIPLGGNRVSNNRWMFNIMCVFLISGLWHGANLTFIIWGFLHGLFLIIESQLKKVKLFTSPARLIKWLVTFACVMLTWIFFRATSMSNAMIIFSKIFSINTENISIALSEVSKFGNVKFIIICFIAFVFIIVDKRLTNLVNSEFSLSLNKNLFIFASLLAAILIFGYYGETQFIYFQF
jgi:D-alanyl-lipoteichoic acid acyltransferase DltB (MBOAT superfamily)